MLQITQQDINNAFNKIITRPDETMILQDIVIRSGYVFFTVLYENKRVSHTYTVWLDYNTLTMRTTIKLANGKNATRSPNTTEVADRILYNLATYIGEKFDVFICPDLIEGNRIIRHLFTSALCYPLIEEYVIDNYLRV